MIQITVEILLILVLRLLQSEVALELLPLVVISSGLIIEPGDGLAPISPVNILSCSGTPRPHRDRAFVALSLFGLELHLKFINAVLQVADFALSLT